MSWIFSNLSKMVIFFSVIMALTLSNFISMWIILEMNFLGFISLLIKKNSNSSEIITYFLIQSFSSILLFLTILIYMFIFNKMMETLIFILIMVKTGCIPFHIWYMKIMKSMNWLSIWFLSTWQKIIPLYMLSFMIQVKLSLMFSFLNAAISSIMIVKQKTLKLMFVYSSTFFLSWILGSLIFSNTMWIMMIMIYMIPMISLVNISTLLDKKLILVMSSEKFNYLIFLTITMLSISGLPPFIMFFLKTFLVFKMMSISTLFSSVLLFSSVTMIYSYMMSFFFLMNLSSKKPNISLVPNWSTFFLLMSQFFLIFIFIN